MATKLNPYVNVPDGQARQALEFYHSVLGGTLQIMTFGEQGTEGPLADQVMHGQIEADHLTLMAADAPPEFVQLVVGNNVSVSLTGDQEDDGWLSAAFDGLAQGGEVQMPLEQAPWGDKFGSLKDKFGINWMVNIAGAPQA
jgi:PhnB protein